MTQRCVPALRCKKLSLLRGAEAGSQRCRAPAAVIREGARDCAERSTRLRNALASVDDACVPLHGVRLHRPSPGISAPRRNGWQIA